MEAATAHPTTMISSPKSRGSGNSCLHNNTKWRQPQPNQQLRKKMHKTSINKWTLLAIITVVLVGQHYPSNRMDTIKEELLKRDLKNNIIAQNTEYEMKGMRFWRKDPYFPDGKLMNRLKRAANGNGSGRGTLGCDDFFRLIWPTDKSSLVTKTKRTVQFLQY